MTAPRLPDWINPGFRLTEGGATLDADRLAERAARLVGPFQQAGMVAVAGGSVARTIAALIAAEVAGITLHLMRGEQIPDTAALVLRSGSHPLSLEGGEGTHRVNKGREKADQHFTFILETSGTTGVPKPVRHAPARLRGRIAATPAAREAVWLLTYDAHGFAGLQVVLTALAGGGRLVAEAGADVPTLTRLAETEGCTHVSATPSFWRGFLTMGIAPPLRSITLGGEAADQFLLDRLRGRFPTARLRHIYASTEAGSLFAVTDGREGFPAAWLSTGIDGTELHLRDGMLHVRSPRRALSRAGGAALAAEDGWIVTGDLVEVVGDRVLFRGRNDGVVNVGGVKVVPEQVEACLLAVPGVLDAAVAAVPSPITGQILTARVVPQPGVDEVTLRAAIRNGLASLPPAARPRRIDLAERLSLAPSGKKRWAGVV